MKMIWGLALLGMFAVSADAQAPATNAITTIQPGRPVPAPPPPAQSRSFTCKPDCRVLRLSGGRLADANLHPSPVPKDMMRQRKQGLVQLAYNIGPDGKAANIVVTVQFGPDAFVQQTIETLQGLTYSPPLLDGKPTTIQGRTRAETYRLYGENRSKPFADALRTARHLRAHDRLDQAIAAIDDAVLRTGGDYNDYAEAAAFKADILLEKNDIPGALKAISAGLLLVQPGAMTNDNAAALHREHFKVAMAAHLYPDAAAALQSVRALGVAETREDRDAAAALADVRAKSGGTYTTHGTIDGAEPGWVRYPISRSYIIADETGGAVTETQIYCRNATDGLPAGDMHQVTLPDGWNDCTVAVFGPPGTSFDLTGN